MAEVALKLLGIPPIQSGEAPELSIWCAFKLWLCEEDGGIPVLVEAFDPQDGLWGASDLQRMKLVAR